MTCEETHQASLTCEETHQASLTCEDSDEYKTMEKINFKVNIHCFSGYSDVNNCFLVENDDNNIKGDDIIVFLNKKERFISFHNICLITSNVKIKSKFKKIIYYDNSFYNMDYESWKIRIDKKLVFNEDTPTKLDEESKYLILKKLTLKPLILDINDFIDIPRESAPVEINEETKDIYEPLKNFEDDCSPLIYKETYSSSIDSQRSLYHIDFSRKINISEKQCLTI